jgi:hypothetical protein
MEPPKIAVELTRAEAIVFVDFLMRFRDREGLAVEHEAESQLLYDLCGMAEQHLPELFDPEWRSLVEKARATVLADPDM